MYFPWNSVHVSNLQFKINCKKSKTFHYKRLRKLFIDEISKLSFCWVIKTFVKLPNIS